MQERINYLHELLRNRLSPEEYELVTELISLERKKRVIIPLTDQDCEDIRCGEEFDWNFNGVDVTVKLEDICEGCELLEFECECS